MDYAEALSWIEKQEGGADVLKAIKGRVDGILDEKRNATRASQQAESRISSLESLAEHLARLAGAEGDDPEARFKSASAKVSALAAELESVKKSLGETESAKVAAETARGEFEQKLRSAESNLKITDAAIASGANPNVLRTLISDSTVTFEINSDSDGSKKVLVVQGEEKKPIQEFAQANWSDFLPSLFPSSNAPAAPKSESRLPGGNPSGQSSEKDPVKDYIAQAGFGLKKTA